MAVKTVGEVLSRLFKQLERGPWRHPVVRTGEREPIPYLLRLSVMLRDDHRCKRCGFGDPSGAGLELDHCLPWSAGGPDDSDNLRVLCAPCNQRRSNWYDVTATRRRLPTTWWCTECWTEPRPRPDWKNGTRLGAAPAVSDPTTLAFCAWCLMTAATDQPLSGDWRRQLLRTGVLPPVPAYQKGADDE